MDPSLAEGHQIVFDREVPFELRIQDPNSGPQEVGTLEAVRAKILLQVSSAAANNLQGDAQNLASIRVELTSESDLFFHYTHNVNEDIFRQMQES